MGSGPGSGVGSRGVAGTGSLSGINEATLAVVVSGQALAASVSDSASVSICSELGEGPAQFTDVGLLISPGEDHQRGRVEEGPSFRPFAVGSESVEVQEFAQAG